MTLRVTIKHVYGNKNIYPLCEQSKIFAKLLGTKTLTSYSIQVIKELGYSFEVVSDDLTL